MEAIDSSTVKPFAGPAARRSPNVKARQSLVCGIGLRPGAMVFSTMRAAISVWPVVPDTGGCRAYGSSVIVGTRATATSPAGAVDPKRCAGAGEARDLPRVRWGAIGDGRKCTGGARHRNHKLDALVAEHGDDEATMRPSSRLSTPRHLNPGRRAAMTQLVRAGIAPAALGATRSYEGSSQYDFLAIATTRRGRCADACMKLAGAPVRRTVGTLGGTRANAGSSRFTPGLVPDCTTGGGRGDRLRSRVYRRAPQDVARDRRRVITPLDGSEMNAGFSHIRTICDGVPRAPRREALAPERIDDTRGSRPCGAGGTRTAPRFCSGA